MVGVFAEFERAMRPCWPSPCQGDWDQGGKPIGRPTIHPALEVSIRDSLAPGVSYRVTAETRGVAVGTVQRIAAASRPFGGAEA
jgi:hypothetical protein